MSPELQQQTDLLLKALWDIDRDNTAIFFVICVHGLLMLICTIFLLIAITKKRRVS